MVGYGRSSEKGEEKKALQEQDVMQGCCGDVLNGVADVGDPLPPTIQ